jgi:hypothetical protein
MGKRPPAGYETLWHANETGGHENRNPPAGTQISWRQDDGRPVAIEEKSGGMFTNYRGAWRNKSFRRGGHKKTS